MTAILLDTHVWAWSFNQTENLSKTALRALDEAEAVLVSPVSFFEISQKTHLGKWPQMEPFVTSLVETLAQQSGVEAPLNGDIGVLAGQLDWPHRDPFDRLLGATALHLNVSLITKDPAFSGLQDLAVVW